jgi:hypothetical protein
MMVTWCRVTMVGPDGVAMVSALLEGPVAPDMGVVDDVARLALLAKRLGGDVLLTEVSRDLRALLELAGLGVQMEG